MKDKLIHNAAKTLHQSFSDKLKTDKLVAYIKVSADNDGPVTVSFDTNNSTFNFNS